jgi:hypothetical protein
MEDRELLTKVSETNDFFGSVLQRDSLDDWHLAKDFGEFMIRLDPEEPMAMRFWQGPIGISGTHNVLLKS